MLDASSQDRLAQEGRMGEAGIKRQEGRRGWLGTGAPQEGIRRATMAQQSRRLSEQNSLNGRMEVLLDFGGSHPEETGSAEDPEAGGGWRTLQ